MAVVMETDAGTKRIVMNQLKEIQDNLEESVCAELDAILEKVKLQAIENCPKDTGALASSINTTGGVTSAEGMFYEASVYAGDPSIINPKSGVPTSQYADLIESGHFLPNGLFYCVPFLAEAMAQYEGELEEAVARALKSLTKGMEDDTPATEQKESS